MDRSEVQGIILAGGQSQRMGENKAFLAHPSGGTFLQHALGLFGESGLNVAISGHLPMEKVPAHQQIRDRQKQQGPLMGIISALEAFPNRHLLVIAVDMPALKMQTMAQILEKPLKNRCLGRCFARQGSKEGGGTFDFFPFPLLLAPASHEPIHAAYLKGERALMPILAHLPLEKRPISKEMAAALVSINTPEELAAFHDSSCPS